MKNKTNILLVCLVLFLTATKSLDAHRRVTSSEKVEIATAIQGTKNIKRVKVGHSFDHFAENSQVARLYVSEEMLSSMHEAGRLKSVRWNFDHIFQRLTSLLTLHTHSQNATLLFRKDYKEVLKNKDYEQLYYLREKNIQIVVFGIRSTGKKLKEMLIFRFRDSYCSRVVQLTGNLSTDDIMTIIRLKQ